MWIKKVKIRGFRSFREPTEIEFDRHHTAIIGKNGSGKSNLLMALFYVLQPQKRQSIRANMLFHEQKDGPNFQAAEIDVVLMNEDNRMSMIPNDEIHVNWSMGLKKDSLRINGKTVSVEYWTTVLKSAGLGRENYFVIQQGECVKLAMTSPTERLKMLETFAGCIDFQSKLLRCQKHLDGSKINVELVGNELRDLQKDINDMGTDTDRLEKYQKYNGIKRALKFVLLTKEQDALNKKRDKFNKKREVFRREQNKQRDLLTEAEISLEEIKEEYKNALADLKRCEAVRKPMQEELENRSKEAQLLEENIAASLRSANEQKENASDQANVKTSLEEEIAGLETELERADDILQKEQSFFHRIEENIRSRKEEKAAYFEKIGHRTLFSNPQEKNQWLRTAIDETDALIATKQSMINAQEERLGKLKTEKNSIETSIVKEEEELVDLQRIHRSNTSKVQEVSRECQTFSQDDKSRQPQLIKAQEAVNDANEKLKETLGALQSKPHLRPLLEGIMSVEKVINHLRSLTREEKSCTHKVDCQKVIEEYRGVVGNNFSYPKHLELALSVTLGNKVFNHVTDSAAVAQQILWWMKKLNLPGEASFMPIDKLLVKNFESPTSKNVKPLQELVEYPQDLDPVFKHLFFRKMLIRQFEPEYLDEVRHYGLECVTLDGEQRSGKGVMTGGYYSSKVKKIELLRKRKQYMQELDEMKKHLSDIEKEMSNLMADFRVKLDEKAHLELKGERTANNLKIATTKLKSFRQRLVTISEEENYLTELLHRQRGDLQSLEIRRVHLSGELDGTLDQNSQEEADKIQVILKELEKLQTNFVKVSKKKRKAEERRGLIAAKLDSLNKQKWSLVSPSPGQTASQLLISSDALKEELLQLNKTISELSRILDTNQEFLACGYKRKESIEEKIQAKESEADQLRTKSVELSTRAIDEEETAIREQMHDVAARLAQGTTSGYEEHFQHMTRKDCLVALEKNERKLLKIGPVNLQAQVMHNSLTEEKAKLEKRRKEFEKTLRKNEAVLEHLIESKDDKVQFTFNQVAKYFKEVFQLLVPTGNAELVFDRSSSPSVDQANNNDLSSVSIHVSFHGNDEMHELSSLSGGQKSTVALAYMFALQKCDPCPIYVFDEVDANLDVRSRKAIADWLQDCKNNTDDSVWKEAPQFITTTFRRELMENADKVIGVKMRQKASHLKEMEKEEALDFITSFRSADN